MTTHHHHTHKNLHTFAQFILLPSTFNDSPNVLPQMLVRTFLCVLLSQVVLSTHIRVPNAELSDGQRSTYARAQVGDKLRNERLAHEEAVLATGTATLKLSNTVELVGSEVYDPAKKKDCGAGCPDAAQQQKTKATIVDKIPFVPNEIGSSRTAKVDEVGANNVETKTPKIVPSVTDTATAADPNVEEMIRS